MGRFIIKHINTMKPQKRIENNVEEINEEVMTTSEKIAMAQSVLSGTDVAASPIKRVKKDKGLIERTDNSTILLTEDNKMVLTD